MTGPAAGYPTLPREAMIPLRAEPFTTDPFDQQRVELVRNRWSSQDTLLVGRDRDIEDTVRMIAGRQWEVFAPTLGQYVDLTQFMPAAERATRNRPTMNRMLLWFLLHHARMTEGVPIVTFQPATADRRDALLAEAMDVLFKIIWDDSRMPEVVDRALAWLIAAGQVHWKSRLDPSAGTLKEMPVMRPDGTVSMVKQRRGGIVVDVMSPLEVRSEWTSRPFEQRRWHIHRTYMPVSEAKHLYGVDLTPEPSAAMRSSLSGNYLSRILFGAGAYGAASTGTPDNPQLTMGSDSGRPTLGQDGDGLVTIDEMWEAPNQPDNPEDNGRLLVVCVAQNKVLMDSTRPFRCRGTSPIRSVRFVDVPGRPSGTTPAEMLKPIQRSINRGWAQILDHRALSTNPMIALDTGSGIDPGQFVSRPGAIIHVNRRQGVVPFEFVSPPQISADVWRTQQMLTETFDFLGNMMGAMGRAPTTNASGELVRELRTNDDRFTGPASRRFINELARMGEDWVAMMPLVLTDEDVLTYVGEDNMVRTLAVMPQMWEGACHAKPDIESMLPESRGERQAKAEKLFAMGAFGSPDDPKAIGRFLEIARYPHLNRMSRPGGPDKLTAERFLADLLRGADPTQQPLFEWYDFDAHLDVMDSFMASPDYLDQQPPVQQALEMRRQMIRQAQAEKFANQIQEEAAKAALMAPLMPPAPADDPNGAPSPTPSQ